MGSVNLAVPMRAKAKREETRSPAAVEVLARPRDSRALEASLFFLFVYVVYVVSPIVASGDSRFVIPTVVSILRRGDANIDEYSHQFKEAPWAIRTENGQHWNVYPIGVPLLSLPWVWLLDQTNRLRGIDFEASVLGRAPLFEELLIASLFTAAAAALLFLIARKRLSMPRALLLGSAFAFGTSAYSSASRGLCQHGPSMMLLAAAVLLFQKLPDWQSPGAMVLGAVAGFSYAVRPTNLIVPLGFGCLVAIRHRARLAPYLVGALAGVLPMLLFNHIAFGTWMNHYYRMLQTSVTIGLPPVKPALAVLVSPSRGLFVFSPFLLLVFARLLPPVLRRKPPSALEILLAVSCLVWWVGVSKWPWWWGGGSYGPRLFSETALYLVILMIPLIEEMSLAESAGRRLLAVAFAATFTLSVGIHFRAATVYAPWDWNNTPVSVDQSPERVWDWRDPQFLRALWK
jgi:hypothetical protein